MMKNVKLGIMALCFLLIFSVVVFASTECPTKEEYRVLLRSAVNDYLTSPSHEKLMNLQDMFKIYATHDFTKCLWKKTCNDGTLYGNCSVVKPLYCDNGKLVNNCQACSCKAGFGCKADSSCAVLTCLDGTLYGKCSVTKPLYCDNGSLVNKCQACNCKAGFGCKADGSCALLTCSDGTVYGKCSVSKPLFCEDGNLVSRCSICNCYEDQVCMGDGGCINGTEIKKPALLMIDAKKLLAQKALETAENTPVKYPEKYGLIVQQEIETAKRLLVQANIEAGNDEYDKAINDYKNSWQHSKKAVEFANKKKPVIIPPKLCGRCSRLQGKSGCWVEWASGLDNICDTSDDDYFGTDRKEICPDTRCKVVGPTKNDCARCSNLAGKETCWAQWHSGPDGICDTADDDYWSSRQESCQDARCKAIRI